LQHIVHLVDELLDIARINSGKLELRKEPLALQAVVDRAIEISRAAIDGRGHALDVALPTPSPQLVADPIRLAQVIGNLLTNAAKYTPRQGRIELAAQVDRDELVLTVSDNGIGIPAPALPRVFDLYAQVDGDRVQGGLGIGLSLVRRLVELHGGQVAVTSGGTDQGSTFTVRLPLGLPPTDGLTG
jgi:signal transduction histidine kinase